MILQSILYPCDTCMCPELYYINADVFIQEENSITIPAASQISFFSYMNSFDIDFWKKYTTVLNVSLVAELSGKGTMLLKCRNGSDDIILSEYAFQTYDAQDFEEINMDIPLSWQKGKCYFEIKSDTNVHMRNARYETSDTMSAHHDIHIALNICTYHRNEDIARNITQLKKCRFFDTSDFLYHRLSIIIVDNGSELETINESNIRLIHNKNTGGSGGFKRGLEEIRRWNEKITHVVFMDDDVEFLNESLYRLYALLSYLKKEYEQEAVAGRMFRMDERHIQYTAAEIWNKGEIKHIGLNADMTKEDNVLTVNHNAGAEYGGWWFCCYPMSFAKVNDPLPFFIHCDDVEYGLRHGGTPIVLNGIQVWHETYEYRQSPVITYYDIRNSLFVNQAMGYVIDYKEILDNWFKQITNAHIKKNYIHEFMCIKGLRDFLRGFQWLYKVDCVKHHALLLKKRNLKIVNIFFWRYTKLLLEREIKHARN